MGNMSKVITSAAHLVICDECHGHARIVCADGTHSDEFATRSSLCLEASMLRSWHKIDDIEMPELIRQITESGLPFRNEKLELELKRQIESGMGWDETGTGFGGRVTNTKPTPRTLH